MNKIIDSLPNQIINSRIDIEALNEYIQQEENNENNVMIDEKGQIFYIQKNEPLLGSFQMLSFCKDINRK